jgi:hypothetical protein
MTVAMRERVPISQGNPSRTTRWRAKRRGGWWCPLYHQRLIKTAGTPPAELVYSSSRRGAFLALALLRLDPEALSPFEVEDLIQEGALRLLQLAGHPGFENPRWRMIAARNAALTFIKGNLTWRRYEKPRKEKRNDQEAEDHLLNRKW